MAVLPKLTWAQGAIHTYTNDTAGDNHPTASLTALSQSIVSSSNWKVTNFSITAASASYPHMIVAPTSTSGAVKDMRIVFVTGLAANANEGPATGDMATNAGTMHTAYDPCIYIGIAPFAGKVPQPDQIATGSLDSEGDPTPGDWRKNAGTKGDIYPVDAKFSGFHCLMGAEVNSQQLQGGGGGLYLIENEEILTMRPHCALFISSRTSSVVVTAERNVR